MNYRLITLVASLLLMPSVLAAPEDDRAALRSFYQQRFPDIAIEAHVDGAYALDAGKRAQWLEMEDFPPYEIAVDDGAELYDQNPSQTVAATLTVSVRRHRRSSSTTRTSTASVTRSSPWNWQSTPAEKRPVTSPGTTSDRTSMR
jgi:hypothetical protein